MATILAVKRITMNVSPLVRTLPLHWSRSIQFRIHRRWTHTFPDHSSRAFKGKIRPIQPPDKPGQNPRIFLKTSPK